MVCRWVLFFRMAVTKSHYRQNLKKKKLINPVFLTPLESRFTVIYLLLAGHVLLLHTSDPLILCYLALLRYIYRLVLFKKKKDDN